MKLGKRAWLVAGALFFAGLLAVAFWPVSSPFLWTYPSAYGSPLTAPDGTIYINNNSGELVALNPDGTVRWKSFVGKFGIIRMARGPDGAIYVSRSSIGPHSGLVSVSPSGTTNWVFREAGPISGKPVFSTDGTIYVGGHWSNLHALNPDGTERWRFPTAGKISDSPVVAPDGTIAFVSEDTNCYALHADGTLRSKFFLEDQRSRHLAFAPAINPDGSLVLCGWTNLMVLSLDGALDWKTNLFERDSAGKATGWAYAYAAPVVSNEGTIYFSTVEGSLQALGGDGRFQWSYHRGFGYRGEQHFTILPKGSLLVAHEKTFQVPIATNRYGFGTEEAAVVQLKPDGSEQWRVEINGQFRWHRFFNFSNFKYERQTGFGIRGHQNLSQPVAGPNGTIYIRSDHGLHAIQPPGKK